MMSETRTVIGKVSLTPRGTYDPEAAYERLDLVQYAGRGYIVLAGTIQGVTPADGDQYMLLAEKGQSPEIAVERGEGGVTITIKDGGVTTTAKVLDGNTPARGADYWTAEDKQAVVNDVLASLPNGDEVSY